MTAPTIVLRPANICIIVLERFPERPVVDITLSETFTWNDGYSFQCTKHTKSSQCSQVSQIDTHSHVTVCCCSYRERGSRRGVENINLSCAVVARKICCSGLWLYIELVRRTPWQEYNQCNVEPLALVERALFSVSLSLCFLRIQPTRPKYFDVIMNWEWSMLDTKRFHSPHIFFLFCSMLTFLFFAFFSSQQFNYVRYQNDYGAQKERVVWVLSDIVDGSLLCCRSLFFFFHFHSFCGVWHFIDFFINIWTEGKANAGEGSVYLKAH